MHTLPSGVVTFVFTDIEASTRILEEHRAVAGRALARHHELVVDEITSAGGHVFETVGDAAYGAFARPADALAGSISLQRSIAAEGWGEIGEIRVRIAVHAGAVEARGAHYFGAALFETARLQSLAHGGQTLTSRSTAELAAAELPDGLELTPLGRHRLKDLATPMDVLQVDPAGLRTEFPPLRASTTIPNNLPIETTSFLGREADVQRVDALLDQGRLVSLLGPGGIGKTRLAIEIARRRMTRHPDGVVLVDLQAITDPALVAPAIADALAVRTHPGEVVEAALTSHLAARDVLLVLDNWEQVVDGAALLSRLLATAPGLYVIATSRVPLRLRGEARYRLTPLAVAIDGSTDLAVLAQLPGIRLFAERAAAASSDFLIDESNTTDVAAICEHLDGLPLAIELAAARIDLMTPATMLRSLLSGRSVLSGGGDRPERQRTLHDAVAWSVNLLGEPERDLLANLSVFSGSFPLRAVDAVTNPGESVDAMALLGTLVDASLLVPRDDPLAEPRFGMLETIRAFAVGELESSGRADEIRRRHAAWVADLAEAGERGIHGRDGQAWARILDLHQGDIRDALTRSIAAPRPEIAARIVGGLRRYWVMRRTGEDGSSWCRSVLALDLPPRWEARVLHTLGNIHLVGGQLDDAHDASARAVELYERTGPKRELAEAINYLANALYELGHSKEAVPHYQRSRELWHEVGDPGGEAVPVGNLGLIAAEVGDFGRAVVLSDEALALDLESEAPLGIAESYLTFAVVELMAGTWHAAREHLSLGLTGFRDVKDEMWLTFGLEHMAAVRLRLDPPEPVPAGRLLGAARHSRERRRLIVQTSDRGILEATTAGVLDALGESGAERALRDGAALDLDAAVRYALGEFDPFAIDDGAGGEARLAAMLDQPPAFE